MNRGFHVSNRRVDGSVGPSEERRNLVDTEQRVRVECESEKHLSCGEVLLVKWRSVGENRLKIAVTAPDSVDTLPSHDALVAASWTGRILPKFLESPLDAGIERLRVNFDDAQLNQLPKHPAERWLSRTHIAKLATAQCNYTVFPQLCIRAISINQQSEGSCSECWLTSMPDEPMPPATLPSGIAEECSALTADQLRELAKYAESLAEYREREARLKTEEESSDEAPDDRPDEVPAGASVTVKEINDNRYRYWQWRDGDKIKSKYIGPANPDD